jgi:hypothetical protein
VTLSVASKGDIKLVFSTYSHSTSPSKWIFLVTRSVASKSHIKHGSLIILILLLQVWIFPVALSVAIKGDFKHGSLNTVFSFYVSK